MGSDRAVVDASGHREHHNLMLPDGRPGDFTPIRSSGEAEEERGLIRQAWDRVVQAHRERVADMEIGA